jgi:uracil-DNA glycosylase
VNRVTELAIQNIHPKWKVLLNLPLMSGKTPMDILDETITKIVELKVKLCPDTPDKILRCLQLDPDLIKVVILNDNPYPTPGMATGLALGIDSKQETVPPSLNVLHRELIKEYDLDPECLFDSTLQSWEEEGILLLNSGLSCEQFKPGSHAKLWEEFIESLLYILNDFKLGRKAMTSLVFVFLGKQAQLFESEISERLHYKIMRYHPAAETYGGNKFTGFFKEVNKYLEESGQQQINWI